MAYRGRGSPYTEDQYDQNMDVVQVLVGRADGIEDGLSVAVGKSYGRDDDLNHLEAEHEAHGSSKEEETTLALHTGNDDANEPKYH